MPRKEKPKKVIALHGRIPSRIKSKHLSMSVEDNGQAMIAEIYGDDKGMGNGMYARIISWDTTKKHPDMKQFMGRKIRVTIETID
jgi:hypothetical protein